MLRTDVPSPPVVLLKVPEVGQRIGRGRTKVFELIKAGQLEAVYFGSRSLRVPSDSVDLYIERVRREAERARRAQRATDHANAPS